MIRYVPQTPLPPYSYVPGMHVHPLSHPDGHSYQMHPPPIETPVELRTCESFLWGIDLFNAGYYWEAHEAWEAVWQALGRAGERADAIKGLIKLAAAGVKAREAAPIGVARHAARALELLSAADESILPIRLSKIRQLAADVSAHADAYLNREAAPVRRIFAVAITTA
ncbi:DUF309 domain-containing protein [Blastopirellula marina]|nr:DUF309 domain-containing protein [Blastopirellula marina]